MMEGPRHQHLHQEWQEPLEEPKGELAQLARSPARALTHAHDTQKLESQISCLHHPNRHLGTRRGRQRPRARRPFPRRLLAL